MIISLKGKVHEVKLRGECPICKTRVHVDPTLNDDLKLVKIDKEGIRVVTCPTLECGYPIVVEYLRNID